MPVNLLKLTSFAARGQFQLARPEGRYEVIEVELPAAMSGSRAPLLGAGALPARRLPVFEPLARPSYDPLGPLSGYDLGKGPQGEPVWSRLKSSIFPVLDLCVDAYYASLSSTFQGDIEFTHHTGAVQELVREGADVEVRDEISGGSPLHFAAGSGSEAICKILLQAKARVCARDSRLQTPLWWAAAGDHRSICTMLLEQDKRQAYSTNIDQLTPLHLASHMGRAGIAELLLSVILGKYNNPNRYGRPERLPSGPNQRAGRGLLSPLHLACRQRNLETAAVLLRATGDPQVVCSLGRTALHHACVGAGSKSHGKDGGLLELCDLLIRCRPSIRSLRDAYGQTAAQLADSKGFFPPELKVLLGRVPAPILDKETDVPATKERTGRRASSASGRFAHARSGVRGKSH